MPQKEVLADLLCSDLLHHVHPIDSVDETVKDKMICQITTIGQMVIEGELSNTMLDSLITTSFLR